jgi:hypothetical protein
MSVITVQIGQCGNQIGEKLFEAFINDCTSTECSHTATTSSKQLPNRRTIERINQLYTSECIERFFSTNENSLESDLNVKGAATAACSNDGTKLFARSVLVDMESKVVNKVINGKANRKSAAAAAALNWSFREHSAYTEKKGSGNNW